MSATGLYREPVKPEPRVGKPGEVWQTPFGSPCFLNERGSWNLKRKFPIALKASAVTEENGFTFLGDSVLGAIKGGAFPYPVGRNQTREHLTRLGITPHSK